MSQLPATQDKPLAVVPQEQIVLNPASIFQAIANREITADSMAVFERAMAWQEREQAKADERAAAADLKEFKLQCGIIKEDSAVPNKDQSLRFTYAKLEQLTAHVAPILDRCNFTYTFDEEWDGDRVTGLFILRHSSGHKIIGKATRRSVGGVSENDSMAATTAKRYALLNTLGIVTEAKEDASLRIGAISQEQADLLRTRVQSALKKGILKTEQSFLNWAKAKSFEEIDKARYGSIDEYLTSKGV